MFKPREWPPQIEWEVLVIDNGSTDETGQVARGSWPADASTRLRVVKEETLGLSRARRRGFLEARHEIVCFVDDDNWVCPAWVEIVSTVMGAHPDVAVCGGDSVAVFEEPEPPWFADTRAASVWVHNARRGDTTRGLSGSGFNHLEIRVDATDRGGF